MSVVLCDHYSQSTNSTIVKFIVGSITKIKKIASKPP